MNNALKVKVASHKSNNEEWWEGTVTLEGTKPTKLSRKADGSTRFTSRAAVQGAARRFAERYGYNDVDFGEKPQQGASKTVKKAAKRSVKPVQQLMVTATGNTTI